MTDDLALAVDLTRVVRSTAGVQDVYTAGGLLAVAAQAVAAQAVATAGGTPDEARVRVGHDTVSVSISVASGFSAPETLRAVTAAIDAHLATVGAAPRRISVVASRIE
jgi:hypothetical protein